MDSLPFTTPTREMREINQDTPSPVQTRDFARQASFTPAGSVTPALSSQTNVPLLPTNNLGPPILHHHDEDSTKPKWMRILTGANEFMLGKEKASVYWYASLLSVIAALVVTGSSIFGWPPLPIWEYLRHVTR